MLLANHHRARVNLIIHSLLEAEDPLSGPKGQCTHPAAVDGNMSSPLLALPASLLVSGSVVDHISHNT